MFDVSTARNNVPAMITALHEYGDEHPMRHVAPLVLRDLLTAVDSGAMQSRHATAALNGLACEGFVVCPEDAYDMHWFDQANDLAADGLLDLDPEEHERRFISFLRRLGGA